jgi:hypothetical protein
MTKITVDPTTSALIRWVKEPVQFVDEDGLLLGTFTPIDKKSLYREVEVPVTDAEIRRRSEQSGGRTLAEILADLEKQS